jgi:hypothetical protein
VLCVQFEVLQARSGLDAGVEGFGKAAVIQIASETSIKELEVGDKTM